MFNKYKHGAGYFLLMSISILFSCQNDPLDIEGGNTDDLDKYVEENNITATKATEGYYFEPIQPNENGLSVANRSIVSIYYSVTSLSGNVIDEHMQADGEPVKLQHGVNAVWPVGIDLGLSKMKEGEVYRFYLPSALAYQSVVSEGIESGASVIAEVEIVEILNEGEQQLIDEQIIENYIEEGNLNNVRKLPSGVRILTLKKGNENLPGAGQEVTIDYSGKFTDNTKFDAANESVKLDDTLMQGLKEGILSMNYGEEALLLIPSQLGYKESVRVIPSRITQSLINSKIIPAYAAQVPPFKVLIFEITLQQ